MTHSFARGFKVSRSIVAPMGGVGGYADARVKMPYPTAPLKAGVGGPLIPGRRQAPPPRRGVGGDCGCDAGDLAMGMHAPNCGYAPVNTPQSLYSTQVTIPPGETVALTAQVQGGTRFCAGRLLVMASVDLNTLSVETVTGNMGQPLLPNAQAVTATAFNPLNATPGGRITGCCVPAALSINATVRNAGDTTATLVQLEYTGAYGS